MILKKLTLISLICLLFSAERNIITNELNKEVTLNGRTYLYGEINREGLLSGNYKNWFANGYENYTVDTQALSSIKPQSLNGVTIKLLMATWCPDSRRNVPVFYKVIDSLKFDETKLQLWSLDSRKQGPNNEQITYGVSRVPTMIFYRNGKEIGRFVERLKPGQTMESVVAAILN
jgi:hypothetical protein